MKINVIGRQMNVYEDMKLLINKKLAKLDKFFSGEGDATVTLSCKHNDRNIEITISAAGALFRSEVRGESFRDALDDACSNIERQIRKFKTKLGKRIRPTANPEPAAEPLPEPEETDFVIHKKSFYFKPMSPEEAILQMNLLGHSFFVFEDSATGDTCVAYARHDGEYGLIVPTHEE